MYNQISANKQRTWILMIVMSAFVLALASALGMLAGMESSPAIIGATILTTIYTLFSYFLSDKIALATNGAQPILKKDAPELYMLVENLTIASGQPMPKIYIVRDDSPNAFATGRDPKHASVAFTTGLLAILSKQELEGVAAHELSHIKNYDIRIMTLIVVLVGAVMLLSDMLMRSSFHGEKKEGAMALMLLGFVLAILSPLCAEIIKLAVSRQREYLADASGALLTRYPEGLASALEKIAAHSTARPLAHANHATAHLFISNPFGNTTRTSWFAKIFATHPPVADRVARLRNMGA